MIYYHITSTTLLRTGSDTLVGGPGQDWMYGDGGDDVFYPGPGADRVRGGPGHDTVILAGDVATGQGVYIDLWNGQGFSADAAGDVYVSIEGVIGTRYADILIGDDNDNVLNGEDGNDVIYPHGGSDVIRGGEGQDWYILDGIKGATLIDNYARDGGQDELFLSTLAKDDVILRRHEASLILTVVHRHGDEICDFGEAGPIVLQNWYKGVKYMHMMVTFEDARESLVDMSVFNPVPYISANETESALCAQFRKLLGN
jgi:hypothetical protein